MAEASFLSVSYFLLILFVFRESCPLRYCVFITPIELLSFKPSGLIITIVSDRSRDVTFLIFSDSSLLSLLEWSIISSPCGITKTFSRDNDRS